MTKLRYWLLAAALVLAGVIAADKVLGPSLNMYAQRDAPATRGANALDCGKLPGFIGGPFVGDAKTARAVFEAVARGLRGDDFMKAYDIEMREEQHDWVVFQSLKPEPDACGVAPPDAATCSVTAGGAALRCVSTSVRLQSRMLTIRADRG